MTSQTRCPVPVLNGYLSPSFDRRKRISLTPQFLVYTPVTPPQIVTYSLSLSARIGGESPDSLCCGVYTSCRTWQIRALCAAERFVSARQSRGTLLCVSPAFQDFAHGRDNPPACAVALQDAQRTCQLNIAHAQHVRFANAQQCRGLEHAPETARHVEVVARSARHVRHADM